MQESCNSRTITSPEETIQCTLAWSKKRELSPLEVTIMSTLAQ